MEISYTCPECGTTLDPTGSIGDATVICPTCALKVPVPAREIGPGTQLGGFEIKELIGKGAMGEVYLARQLSMERDVALKVLSPHFASHDYAVQRFLKEVRMSARVEHPNIVRAYEAGEDKGVYFLAMAYVKGESLAQRLKRVGRYSEREGLVLGRRIAAALQQAWQDHGLLHRDVKPANILISQRGEPLLADLGLAKQQDESDGMTQPGSVLGTPNYMSPEQIDGQGGIDFRTDMYGLGATMYHAMTGQVPFKGTTLVETLKKQATEALPDPRELNPGLSDGCVRILIRMLAKDPGDRYPEWRYCIEDMDRVLAGDSPCLPGLTAGQSMILRAGEPWPSPSAETVIVSPVNSSPSGPRVSPAAIGWGGAIVGAVLVLAGGSWWMEHRSPVSEDTTPPPMARPAADDGQPDLRPAPKGGPVMSLEEIGRVLDQASDELLALNGEGVRQHVATVKAQLPSGLNLPPQVEGLERMAILLGEMQGDPRSREMRQRLETSELAEAGLLLGILDYEEGRLEEAMRRFQKSGSVVGGSLIRRIETRATP